jgi:hypothetical protein
VNRAFEQMSIAERESQALQLEAQKRLQEAARLQSMAQQRQQETLMAERRAQEELQAAQQRIIAAATDAEHAKQAEASRARALAELEAKTAARKKVRPCAVPAAAMRPPACCRRPLAGTCPLSAPGRSQPLPPPV